MTISNSVVNQSRDGTDLSSALSALVQEAYAISSDIGSAISAIVEEGTRHPLNESEGAALLSKILRELHSQIPIVQASGEDLTGAIDALARRIVAARGKLELGFQGTAPPRVSLLKEHNGISQTAIRPTPMFHGRSVPMVGGYVQTTQIKLWDANERLDIYISQFFAKHRRKPTSDELLQIMQGEMVLPGHSDLPNLKRSESEDFFGIRALARSIAANGVRKAAIIDQDGTLLDGNRRVAACYLILKSDEFDDAERKRVEHLFVWQLTEHATDEDRRAVIVSLNFEDDCKVQWPEYVRARKVYDEWQEMRSREMLATEPRRQAVLKKELSKKFALGPDASIVNRYIKMVEFADQFEEYHIENRSRDQFEVQHRAARYFQYFDELTKGERNGVNSVLSGDSAYCHAVFDLLYDGKFNSWRDIRELKRIYENEEAKEQLLKARLAGTSEDGQSIVEQAVTIAKVKSAEQREVGANSRIEVFVKWLEELPVRAFRDTIKLENLQALERALLLVERHVREQGSATVDLFSDAKGSDQA